MRHDSACTLTASRPTAPRRRILPLLLRSGLACLLFGGLCLPAGATTLVRCKINHKIVYSDTDCPANAISERSNRANHTNRTNRGGFTDWPVSRPVTIRYPRAKPPAASRSKKTASR